MIGLRAAKNHCIRTLLLRRPANINQQAKAYKDAPGCRPLGHWPETALIRDHSLSPGRGPIVTGRNTAYRSRSTLATEQLIFERGPQLCDVASGESMVPSPYSEFHQCENRPDENGKPDYPTCQRQRIARPTRRHCLIHLARLVAICVAPAQTPKPTVKFSPLQ
jgi:hypothetical protein